MLVRTRIPQLLAVFIALIYSRVEEMPEENIQHINFPDPQLDIISKGTPELDVTEYLEIQY